MRNRRQYRQGGFNLVEIMVVVVIIGLLAAIVGNQVLQYLSDARIETAKTQIREFADALQLYKIKKGRFPSTSQGLEVLTEEDKNGNSFISKIPADPWGNDYEYRRVRNKFEITSYGADGEEDGEGEAADIKFSDLGKKEDE